jgi:hypothetical protein
MKTKNIKQDKTPMSNKWLAHKMRGLTVDSKDLAVTIMHGKDAAAAATVEIMSCMPHPFLLALASEYGCLDTVLALLSKGVRVASDEHYALRHARTADIAKVLLRHGADPCACGCHPFVRACEAGALEVALVIEDTGRVSVEALTRGLRKARAHGHVGIIEWLVPMVGDQEPIVYRQAMEAKHASFATFLKDIGASGDL